MTSSCLCHSPVSQPGRALPRLIIRLRTELEAPADLSSVLDQEVRFRLGLVTGESFDPRWQVLLR